MYALNAVVRVPLPFLLLGFEGRPSTYRGIVLGIAVPQFHLESFLILTAKPSALLAAI